MVNPIIIVPKIYLTPSTITLKCKATKGAIGSLAREVEIYKVLFTPEKDKDMNEYLILHNEWRQGWVLEYIHSSTTVILSNSTLSNRKISVKVPFETFMALQAQGPLAEQSLAFCTIDKEVSLYSKSWPDHICIDENSHLSFRTSGKDWEGYLIQAEGSQPAQSFACLLSKNGESKWYATLDKQTLPASIWFKRPYLKLPDSYYADWLLLFLRNNSTEVPAISWSALTSSNALFNTAHYSEESVQKLSNRTLVSLCTLKGDSSMPANLRFSDISHPLGDGSNEDLKAAWNAAISSIKNKGVGTFSLTFGFLSRDFKGKHKACICIRSNTFYELIKFKPMPLDSIFEIMSDFVERNALGIRMVRTTTGGYTLQHVDNKDGAYIAKALPRR